MRKQTKLVAVLSAAALLAIGASMTSFAATPHWDQQDNEWVYLDRNGDRVTSEWKKSNNQWYYLDENGFMARNLVIEDDEDKYYVGEDGARVTNSWVSMDNEDLLDDDDATESIDTVWMYFDGTGKALGCGTSGGNGEIKKLTYGDNQSGYFIFNADGYMLSGWQKWDKKGTEEDLYYLGGQNEGWARTGWNYLEVDTDLDAFADVDVDDDNFTDESYFYFQSNGKAYVDASKSIGGKYYSFDKFGRMLDLWVYPEDGVASDSGYTNKAASASSAEDGSVFYREGNGGREKDWIYAYPTSGYDNYDDDPYWFYLDSKGKPFKAANTAGSATCVNDDDDEADASKAKYNKKVSTKKIKNNTYLFNDKGVMLTGLYELDGTVKKNNGDSEQGAGIYYFTVDGNHGSTEGQMVTNKKVKIEVNDEDETYYFDKNGRAYTNTIVSGYIYDYKGQLYTKAGEGNTYQKVAIEKIVGTGAKTEIHDGKECYVIAVKGKNTPYYIPAESEVLVNENGKIKESGRVSKDYDEKPVEVKDCVVVSTNK